VSQKVRIVFRNEIIGGVPEATVRERAAQLLKATPEQITRIFSGKPIVLRKELPKEEGASYQKRLEEIGMRAYIEAIEEAAPPSPPPSSSEPSFGGTPFPEITEPFTLELISTPAPLPDVSPVPSEQPQASGASLGLASLGEAPEPKKERLPAERLPAAMPTMMSASANRSRPSGNPYRARAAEEDTGVADNHEPAGLMDYLSFAPSGRIKRLPHWTAAFFWSALCTLVLGFFSIRIQGDMFGMVTSGDPQGAVGSMVANSVWIIVLAIVFLVISVRFAIQRCRDIGWTPWLVLLIFVPIVNLFFALCLFFWPSGTEEAPKGSWVLLLIGLVLAVACSTWYGSHVKKMNAQVQEQLMRQGVEKGNLSEEQVRRFMGLMQKAQGGGITEAEKRELEELMQKMSQQQKR